MKIAEVVGPDLEYDFTTDPSAALMQKIASAFTAGGQVKAHWDAAGLGGQQNFSAGETPVSTVRSTDVAPSGPVAGLASPGEVPPVHDLNVEPRPGMGRFGDRLQTRAVLRGSVRRSTDNW
jgi:hypothetical protein